MKTPTVDYTSSPNSSFLNDTLERNISQVISVLESPSTSTSVPEQSKSAILNGVVAYVEVRSGAENRTKAVCNELLSMGATIAASFTKDVTHVIFKGGKKSTLQKARKREIPIVSVLWMDSCKKNGSKVAEGQFPAREAELLDSPHFKLIKFKRCKSMQPKDFDEAMADSAERLKKREKKKAKGNRSPRFKHLEIPGITYHTPESRPPFFVENTVFKPNAVYMSPLPPVPETPPSMRAKLEKLKRRGNGEDSSDFSSDEDSVSEATGADGLPLSRKLFEAPTCSEGNLNITKSSSGEKRSSLTLPDKPAGNVDSSPTVPDKPAENMDSSPTCGALQVEENDGEEQVTDEDAETSPVVPIVQPSAINQLSGRTGNGAASGSSDSVGNQPKKKKRKLLRFAEDEGLTVTCSPGQVERNGRLIKASTSDALYADNESQQLEKNRGKTLSKKTPQATVKKVMFTEHVNVNVNQRKRKRQATQDKSQPLLPSSEQETTAANTKATNRRRSVRLQVNPEKNEAASSDTVVSESARSSGTAKPANNRRKSTRLSCGGKNLIQACEKDESGGVQGASSSTSSAQTSANSRKSTSPPEKKGNKQRGGKKRGSGGSESELSLALSLSTDSAFTDASPLTTVRESNPGESILSRVYANSPKVGSKGGRKSLSRQKLSIENQRAAGKSKDCLTVNQTYENVPLAEETVEENESLSSSAAATRRSLEDFDLTSAVSLHTTISLEKASQNVQNTRKMSRNVRKSTPAMCSEIDKAQQAPATRRQPRRASVAVSSQAYKPNADQVKAVPKVNKGRRSLVMTSCHFE